MPFHIIFEPPVGGARSVGRFACMPACRLTCRQASRMAGWTAGRLKRGQACRHSCRYNHFLKSSHPFIPVLLLGSLGIRKRCFESRNNNTCSNPFIDGFLVLSKAQQQGVLRVTRRLFGYCRKVAAARYVSSYSKPFGLLRKPCRRVASPKSGNLF